MVSEFDAHRGLGTVTADDGGSFGFHCTAIADGTRDIAVGTGVTFTVVPGHNGQWEASDIRPREWP